MRWLLDTNVVIGLLDPARRNRILPHLEAQDPGSVVTSTIVAHELYFGAAKSARPTENSRLLDTILAEILPLPLAPDDAASAAIVRADLRRRGTPIGPYDVLIAGQALARRLILVTNNLREFGRVDGLKLVDWLG